MKLLGIDRRVGNTLLLCLVSLSTIFSCQSKGSETTSDPQPSSEVHFENGTNAYGIPFRIVDNNMYVTITINDSVEVDVAFDSGLPLNGVLVMDSVIGDKLGLTYVGSAPLGGAGDETSMADIALGNSIALPGVSFANQQILVARNTQEYKEWLVDGIIGGTLLNSCVVEIDHEKSVINLYESDSFDSQTAGEALEVTFSQGIPVVEATVEHEGRTSARVKLLVDTGADVPFTIHFYDGLHLQPPPNAPESYLSEGINGDVYGQWSRLDMIRFASLKMENCIVAYPTEGFDDVKVALGQNGFFGLPAQRRFTVTFDYPHARIYLKPNSRYKDPFEFNMAGLVLRTLNNQTWEVMDVLPNSPAGAVGIKKGDFIVAVNGRSSSSISFIEMERLFVQENQPMQISITRNDSLFNVKLVLKRMI
jgi:hypothetical protein